MNRYEGSSPLLDVDPEWVPDGACTGYPPSMFHPTAGSAEEDEALDICNGCLVACLCLEWIMERELAGALGEWPIERHGIYGATTPFQRSELYRARLEGRVPTGR